MSIIRKHAEAELATATTAYLDALAEQDKLRQRHAEEQAAVYETILTAEVALDRAKAVAAIAKINAEALSSLRANTPGGPGSRSLMLADLAERQSYSWRGTIHKHPATWTKLGHLAREILNELESPTERA